MQFACMCDYCGDIFPGNKIRDHEAKCTYNPKTRSCYTCEYCYTDYDDIIKCSKKNIVSVTFMTHDLVTSGCDEYEQGHPTQIVHL